MEEKGYIEIKINNRSKTLTPKDIDVSEIKEIISDVETLLFPTRQEKKMRPKISLDIEEGSSRNIFYLPISSVIFFNGIINEIKSRNSINFLDYKRQSVIYNFQKKAINDDYTFELINSLSPDSSLIINKNSDFQMTALDYIESEFYLYGEIYQEGGRNPNLHVNTEKFGNLTISATKEQLLQGEKKIYKFYGLKVSGKKSIEEGNVFDLKLIDYIEYEPIFNKNLLNDIIKKAAENLKKIKNVDDWIFNLKAEGI